ncbi:sensor histidine kinase [Virgisporangium aurantiacum]|uniref:sensor histidine kinase n=1 Tax=Virgisporangium aurantiacum TaxID=175570 RepID=UPI003570F4CE
MGRTRRPVHRRRPAHDPQTAAQARRPARRRDHPRRRVPDPVRRPRATLRLRLTIVYGGLFLLAGLALLGVTFLLFERQLSQYSEARTPDHRQPRMVIEAEDGVLTGAAAAEWVARQEAEIHAAATTSLVAQGSIALLVVGAAATASGWLVAGRVLGPLHRVTATARRIAAAPPTDGSLRHRIDLDGPDDEVKELADTFDGMVERLDHAFDGQRRFVANASHELRTPLTLNRAVVELAMHRRTASPDVIRLGESLLQINARHERLITGLLLLARSGHEIAERSPVDVADVVSHVVTQAKAEADAADVRIEAEPGPAPTRGDPLLLERLVHNLVENGVRHNTGDGTGWVRVTSRTVSGTVQIVVGNSGPNVPPYEIPTLFEPFRRLRPDRVVADTGTGLGLSIVRSVARAHGGHVSAVPGPGGGLVVTVTLPADRRAP